METPSYLHLPNPADVAGESGSRERLLSLTEMLVEGLNRGFDDIRAISRGELDPVDRAQAEEPAQP